MVRSTPPGVDPGAQLTRERRQFQMKTCLGRGGFGEVYRATMIGAGGVRIEVAVKVLHAEVDPSSQAVQRLKDEARLMGAVHHPSVLAVHGLVLLDGRVALVTEFVDGQDLDKCLQGKDPIGLRALVQVTGRVAEALDAAWNAPTPDGKGRIRLVHRDIKPSNIRLGKHGEVKVLDFGIARASAVEREARTETNAMLGSYLYMAPERFLESGDSGPAVDVFSLGATLYEGLANRRLFGDMALKDLYLLVLDEQKYEQYVQAQLDRLPKDVPHQIVTLIYRMVAHDPKDRPTEPELAQTCYELAEKLRGPSLDKWARGREWPVPRTVRGMLDGALITETGFTSAVDRAALVRSAPPPAPVASETFEGVFDLARTASATFERPGVVMGVGVGLMGVGTAIVTIALAVVLALGVAWWVWTRPEPDAMPPIIVQPLPPEPAPPEPAPPAPVKVAPAPAPAPPPKVEAPRPAPEKVVVVRPPPAPAPAPAPPPEEVRPAPVAVADATVTVEGGILVDFVGEDGSRRRAGRIPPGTYQIRAFFGPNSTPAGTLYLTPGEVVTVACSKLKQTCVRK